MGAEFQIVHPSLWQDEIPSSSYQNGTYQLEEPKCNVIMQGQIVPGDLEKLKGAYRIAQRGRKMTPSYLCLNSLGGNLYEALAITNWLIKGEGIGIGTVVDANARCFSSCAVIFMGGSRIDHNIVGYAPMVERWLHARGELGFHAPYIDGSGVPRTNITKDEALNFYRAAQEATKKIMSTFQNRITTDSSLPGRSNWVRASLFYELMLKGPNEFLLIDSIDAVGRWEIALFGAKRANIQMVNDSMVRQSCRNLISWTDDRSAIEENAYFDGAIKSKNLIRNPHGADYYQTTQYRVLVSPRFQQECLFSINSLLSGAVIDVHASFSTEGNVSSATGGSWWSMLPPTTKLATVSN